jgi:hypothetical protein
VVKVAVMVVKGGAVVVVVVVVVARGAGVGKVGGRAAVRAVARAAARVAARVAVVRAARVVKGKRGSVLGMRRIKRAGRTTTGRRALRRRPPGVWGSGHQQSGGRQASGQAVVYVGEM